MPNTEAYAAAEQQVRMFVKGGRDEGDEQGKKGAYLTQYPITLDDIGIKYSFAKRNPAERAREVEEFCRQRMCCCRCQCSIGMMHWQPIKW